MLFFFLNRIHHHEKEEGIEQIEKEVKEKVHTEVVIIIYFSILNFLNLLFIRCATKHIINHETKEITIYLLTLSLVWIPNTVYSYIFKLIGNATYWYRSLCTVYVQSS